MPLIISSSSVSVRVASSDDVICVSTLSVRRSRYMQRLEQPLVREAERQTVLIRLVRQYSHNSMPDHLHAQRHTKTLQESLLADPFSGCKNSHRSLAQFGSVSQPGYEDNKADAQVHRVRRLLER